MHDKKIMTTIFLAVFFLFFIIVFPSTITVSAEKTNRKEIKEFKPEIKQEKEVKKETNPYANAQISIKIIPSINKTFGYDILIKGKQLIHQPNIPGLPGNDGFKTKKRAQKVAEFVVKKIRKNEMPPTVTIEDLNKMDALK